MTLFLQNFILKYGYWLGLLIGLGFFSLKAIGYNFSSFPGDLGDARFNIYILEHAHQYFFGGGTAGSTYWNAPFMYPTPQIIAYSDNLLGTFPIFSFFRALGFNIYHSFQCWYLMLTALNYTTAYFLIKWLFKNKQVAILGAFVFAFSLALQSQIVHAQTFPRFIAPLAIWSALLFAKYFHPRYFLLAILCFVYQLYSGIYLGFLLFIPLTVSLIGAFLYNRKLWLKQINLRWILYFTGSLLLALLLIVPLMIPYQSRSEGLTPMTFQQIEHSIPVLQSYLFSHSGSIIWKDLSQLGTNLQYWWNHQLFPGGMVILSLFFGLFSIFSPKKLKQFIRNKTIGILLFSFITSFLIFLKFNDFSFYQYIMKIPGFDSMRALQRYINVELIFFAIALSFMAKHLFQAFKPKYQALAFSIFFLFLVLDNLVKSEDYVKTKITDSEKRVDRIVAQIHSNENVEIISFEPDSLITADLHYQIDAMLAAQKMKVKSINGYSATSAPGFDSYWRNPNETNRINWCKQNDIPLSKVTVVK